MVKIPTELQPQNVGKDMSGAACVQVSEACERCVSGKIDDHKLGGEVNILMFELGKEAKIPDLWDMSVLSEIRPEK